MPARRAVFTALLGSYEELIEQPWAARSDVDFICFTDSPDLVADSWDVRRVEPLFPLDLGRSQRALKILGHESLQGYDELIYIDNSVMLTADPREVFETWLDGADLAIPTHSFREHVIDEFDVVVELRYDDPARVHEQLLHYAELHPEVLDERPYWNGFSARRRTPAVDAAMTRWFQHVLRYSRRDQLSINVALAESDVAVRRIEIDNNESPWHRWPVVLTRDPRATEIPLRRSGPLLAENARLRRFANEAESRTHSLQTELTRTRAGLEEAYAREGELAAQIAQLRRRFPARVRSLLRRLYTGWRARRASSANSR